MRTDEELENARPSDDDESLKMQRIIAGYSKFQKSSPGSLPIPERDVVILAGATGALCAHLLKQLLDDPKVECVVCLVRSNDAIGRIAEFIKIRKLDARVSDNKRLTALKTDNLGALNLGLSSESYSDLQQSAILIIHAAWPVNFNVSLTSMIPHIAGLHNLLHLTLRVYRPRSKHPRPPLYSKGPCRLSASRRQLGTRAPSS